MLYLFSPKLIQKQAAYVIKLLNSSLVAYKKVLKLAELFNAISFINPVMTAGRQEASSEFMTCLLGKLQEDFSMHAAGLYTKKHVLNVCPVTQNLSSDVTISELKVN